jgi:CHAT domain-containing protein
VEAVTARGAGVRFESPGERSARVRSADAAVPGLATALSTMILQPVAAAIDGKRLAIVADGALEYVPWGALPTPTGAGGGSAPFGGEPWPGVPPLVATHEIVQLPSAAVLRTLRQGPPEPAEPTGTLAVVADPVLDAGDPRLRTPQVAPAPAGAMASAASRLLRLRAGGPRPQSWPALPYARQEAAEILAMAPPARRLAALGLAANTRFVRRGGLDHYGIVHFATHAVVDGERPERSGLVLSLVDEAGRSQDGFLSLFDLYDLDLDASLVVLSGCRTGLGEDLRGEGLVGLTRGFLFAGARRVAVSLWDVDDRATGVLMRRFYEGVLHDRIPPGEALRRAQLSMAVAGSWQQPYFWAGFVLQGDW